jgi:hypothetical protein
MAMTRQELTAVREVIDALLRCPDHVRELLTQWIAPQARWLAPEARSKERTVPLIFSKPNGRDPHPPSLTSPETPSVTKEVSSRRSPRSGKARPGALPKADRKLIEAMRDNPGLTVVALANAAGSSRSATGDRLRRLAASGAIEKDAAGRWRLAGEKALEPGGFASTGAEPGPTQPPSP